MEQKVEGLIEFLKNTISGWHRVECITTDARAEADVMDPYFALVIDVYCRGKVPSAEVRQTAFGDPGAFESSAGRTKDRFFLKEIPIRIEYKDVSHMNKLVGTPTRQIRILKNSGTYPFYRLQKNKVIFDASGWIGGIREELERFPEDAWESLRDSFSFKMEHYLSDMGAASFSGDKFFHLLSVSGFMRYAAASVFMFNRRFEPSHREFEEQLRALPRLPESFMHLWDLILEKEREVPDDKRFELARILARGVFSLQ